MQTVQQIAQGIIDREGGYVNGRCNELWCYNSYDAQAWDGFRC